MSCCFLRWTKTTMLSGPKHLCEGTSSSFWMSDVLSASTQGMLEMATAHVSYEDIRIFHGKQINISDIALCGSDKTFRKQSIYCR